MKRLKIHILYEYGDDRQPYGSSQIRLLRPLSHPLLRDKMTVTTGLTYQGEAVDAVIVDRLWRPDVSPDLLESLIHNVRQAGPKLIYGIDDNLLDLPAERDDWPDKGKLWVVEQLLRQADGVLVTTPLLKTRLSNFNQNIVVLSQALDERLLTQLKFSEKMARTFKRIVKRLLKRDRIVIGYMGTLTHDDDFKMIAPALRAVILRHRDRVEFQIVGVTGQRATLEILAGLPLRNIVLQTEQYYYPAFMPWFTSHLRWDIGIAPLQDTPFTRCKSDIKFLDYSALGIAGIFSNVPAYQHSVRHLETGWLAENQTEAWEAALETLLVQSRLRKRLARNARHYLSSKRLLATSALNWLQALQTLLETGS